MAQMPPRRADLGVAAIAIHLALRAQEWLAPFVGVANGPVLAVVVDLTSRAGVELAESIFATALFGMTVSV